MASKKQKKTGAIIAALVAAALLFAVGEWLLPGEQFAPVEGALAVHFIDVGQGDCTLIEAQGRFMLIDGGERGSEAAVIKYLQARGVERLDYVVATHPHSDHIGGLAYGILEAFPAGTILMPRLSPDNTPTTNTYEAFLAAVAAQKSNGASALYAVPGTVYALGEAEFTILGPLEEDLSNQNNNSVSLRLRYGSTAALFTGDAEKSAEAALVAAYPFGLGAQLLKAGHHGSNTSCSAEFLQAVAPKYAVACCGLDNSYGHPDTRMLERCAAANVTVFRTDIHGTVVMISDGTEFHRYTAE